MKAGLRMRVAAWCAALVIASGTIVVLIVVVLTGHLLKANNQPPRPQNAPLAGQPIPPRPLETPHDRAQRLAAQKTLREVREAGLAVVVGLAVVAVGASWVVAGRIIRPIRTITSTARDVAADHRLSRRIGSTGADDELKELSDEFDRMLDRLEHSFGAHRAFVANVSHELRTPLAVMRTEVDVAIDDPDATADGQRSTLEALREEIDRMTGLVEAMLSLARAEVVAAKAPVDLAEVAAMALARAALPSTTDLVVDTALDAAPVAGD
ncbi:MAG TPA: histidine kinase dimerization/phospho-acceptor domain-containing protein, partial [Acidimicrobiales bacterium]